MKKASSSAGQRESRADQSGYRAAIEAANNLCNTLARLLIALRQHAGFSHEEVAARAGISAATVRTHEAAGIRTKFVDTVRICQALGFDCITALYEVDRRLVEAGTPFLPDQPPTSERAFLKSRCVPLVDVPVAEIRRQLRIMRQLTLPKRPGPPNRKRPAASSRARPAGGKAGRMTKERKS